MKNQDEIIKFFASIQATLPDRKIAITNFTRISAPKMS